ncbi:MAG: hypothetical protein ABR953_12225 [Candidatus Acidiferrales bacterium]|jgi:hypothetical protein
MRRTAPVVAALLIAFLVLWVQSGKAHSSGREQNSINANDCDRKCLYGIVDAYMDALVAKDTSRLPWAKTVKFTENNVVLQVGDGLWGTISGKGPDDLRAADPTNGQVAYFGVVDERGNKAFFAVRLKIEDRKISEVETIVDRKGYGPGPFGDPDKMAPLPILVEDVPPEQRRPRERMVALADGYFSTLQLNDGQIFTQFDSACSRRENGVWTANDPNPDPNSNTSLSSYGKISCEAGFKLGNYRWDDRLRDRRYPLIDEAKGLVLAGGFIDHAGRLETYTTTDGVTHQSPMRSPHSFCLLEMFKIKDGKIRHAEAVFITVPYYMPSPWVRSGD